MTDTFLLEIGLEEMPDNAIQSAEQQLVEKTKQFLDEHHLKYDDVLGFSTPRRFAVMVKDLEDKQPDENLIVRGPSQKIAQDEEGNWTKAAIGFSKGQGGDVEDLIIKEDNGEPYVFIEKFIPGKESKELLKGLTEVVKNIEFPKLMKWGDNSYHYVRPIHWVLSLLGKQVVPIEVFDIKSSDTTLGHRFLGEKIKINHPSEYEKKLKEQYVIADRQARKEMIINQMNELCKENNWTVPHLHSHLLEEVTDLVEYPTAFYGSFEESYLDIPNIVLETSMIDHQRYFSVWSSDESNLLAYFISVRNGNENHIETVAKGNEKVLSARLADAKFFYDEDKEKSIQEHIEKLKLLDYHEDLGTMYEKQNRVNKMVERMDQYVELSVDEKNNLNRASSIYKFDLVTQMVGEFPNLQGKIGAIYARQQGENEVVSEAIGEQYLPSSAKGELGKSKVAKLLAMADKLDSLIQFFSADIIPTGSNDPYALRRQAMGVVRLILSFDLHKLNLKDFLEDMINVSDLPANRLEQLKENKENLMNFILSRLEQILQSKYEISHDIRQAVFGLEEK
ncbi:MAG: glycine--tRNA ligase subunit beta, partial [Atopostipes sp.]|nr:glycine--tRNA ligase subunit beta [Atopostipes sp.]